jgi:cobalt-zinc-cadmium resistance protein CzcA
VLAVLSALVDASLRHRAVVLVLALLFILVGVQAARRLPMDAVPDVTNVQVQILTAAPALSPIEVEQYVTVPVERAMSGLPHMTEVRSVSKYGLSLVTVVFADDTDIYRARQLVAERMREASAAVPERYGQPEMGPITTGLGEVFQFVVRGRSLMEVEETLDWYIAPQLRTVPGVVEVNSHGGENKEYQVVLDPARLQALGLSLREVADALARSNHNAGGGYFEHNREQYVIGAIGLVRDLSDLRSVVVGATPQGVPITVGQLGDVRLGPSLRRGAASMDARGEVAVGVALMLLGESARTVTAAVKQKLSSLSSTLPPGVTVEPFYDRSALVDRTIHTVIVNLLEGAALVVLVLLILLRDLRAGLIVAVTIPLSMLFALLGMQRLGASGNLMSLGTIDFGLIVDGAVIIVENAVRRLGEAQSLSAQPLGGEDRVRIVRDAAIEVRGATIFGEAIIAIVYVPILALGGIEGKLFRPMATTVLLALCGAILCSLTVVPVLCSLLLKPAPGAAHGPAPGSILGRLAAGYERLLKASVRRRYVTLLVGAAALALGALCATRLGAEFVPQLDEGDLLIEARRLPGVALSESVAMDTRMQRAALLVPEVAHAVSRTGSPELANDVMGIEQTDLYLILRPRDKWRRGLTKDALGAELAERIGRAVPEAAIAVSQPIQMRTNELLEGVRSDVAAVVYGPDLGVLRSVGERLQRVIAKVPGAVDVRAEQSAGLSYLRIYPDRQRLARYGLGIEEVNQLTQALAVGLPVGQVFEGERRFSLVVKLQTGFDGSVEHLRSLPLHSRTGQVVPLGDVADVVIEPGPVQVSRSAQSRRLIVEFNVDRLGQSGGRAEGKGQGGGSHDMLSVVQRAQAAVRSHITLPPGYRIEWGGQFEHFIEARDRLLVVVPLALALILFLLWQAFDALRPALIIFCNVPFAGIGGAVALWLRGIPFSISAGAGFIALFGVSVLNGLVLVSFSRRLEHTDKDTGAPGLLPAMAIAEAARLRLRPVLMTALVAALGFAPMAVSTSPGSEVQRPLATVVIGGLVSATLLTLLLFPAVYAAAHRKKASP